MGKTWLITGLSSGLGRMLTEKALARGDRVFGTSRRADTLSDLRERYPQQLRILALDLKAPAAVREAVDRAFGEAGRIDIVVSNAGYGLLGAAEEADGTQIRNIIDTNLVGSITLIQAALPHLRNQGGGRILQVSSEGGQIAYPGFGLYHATKWGIEGFVESVAQEVAPFGIDFIIVEPGPTATNFGAALDRTKPTGIYEGTPAGEVRRGIASGEFAIRGDAGKTVDAMIAAADADQPPFRLTLGSTAYGNIRTALTRRLAALEAQREIAFSVDRKED